MRGSSRTGDRIARACRLCRCHGLQIVHDFGLQPVAGYLDDTLAAALAAPKFPNAIAMCSACGFVQQAFDDAIPTLVERVYSRYQPTYSMSTTVKRYMLSFLDSALNTVALETDGYVLEIGSNDGAVLADLQRRGHKAVGLDPSGDPESAARAGLTVIRDYFGSASAAQLLDAHGPATLVLSRHTLEHVFDPSDFLRGIAAVLTPDGRAVIEVPYLHEQMVNNQFQSMTFQHVSFFTTTTMHRLIESAGLSLLRLAFSPMDAGSLIAVVGHRCAKGSFASEALALERAALLDKPEGVASFFANVSRQSEIIHSFLDARLDGPVCAFGAGSKGQALMNMLRLDRNTVPYVIDETPGAAGSFVPGVGTEVVSLNDDRLRAVGLLFITASSHVREIVHRAQSRFDASMPILATTPSLHLIAPALGSA